MYTVKLSRIRYKIRFSCHLMCLSPKRSKILFSPSTGAVVAKQIRTLAFGKSPPPGSFSTPTKTLLNKPSPCAGCLSWNTIQPASHVLSLNAPGIEFWKSNHHFWLESMSTKYKFRNPDGIYFVSFAVAGWVDVFTRAEYSDTVIDSLS